MQKKEKNVEDQGEKGEDYILCNDSVCEGDAIADKLEIANAKVAKLIGIMSFKDEDFKHIRGGYIQDLQMAKFLEAYPDEK